MEKQEIKSLVKKYVRQGLSAVELKERLNAEKVPTLNGGTWSLPNASLWRTKINSESKGAPKIKLYKGSAETPKRRVTKTRVPSAGIVTVLMGSPEQVAQILAVIK